VSALAFLSPSGCDPELLASPLARALDGVDPELVADLSLDGKVELRGAIDAVAPGEGEEIVRLSAGRALLLTDDPTAAIERVRAAGVRAYDATGLLAGFAVHGEQLVRRLTDLDLDALPAAGPFAHVAAIVLREDGDRFRVYVPQELGHDVVHAVLDTYEGLS
jgi:hypothetical protein